MDALREQIDDDLPGKLRKARDSYQEAADAYAEYIPRLQEAQDTLDRAVDEARAGQAQASTSPVVLGAEPTEEEEADARAARDRIDAGQDQLRSARGLAAQARSLRDRAAARCADQLDRAADKAIRIPKKRFFQRVSDFFKKFPFFRILLAILIAIVTVFVPVVGVLLAGLLFVFEQATAIATGAFQLGDFLVGLVGLIPGGSLLRVTGAGKSFLSGVFPDLASTLTKISSLSSAKLTVDIALDFGKEAAAAGLNAAGSGQAFNFNAGAAFAGAAAGGALGAGLRGLEPTRFDPPPPGPPGKSDFSAFENLAREQRADEQFQQVTSDVVGGQASDLVEAIQGGDESDGGIPIKGSTESTPPA